MKAFPAPCAMMMAKAISAHTTATAAAGARATTDSSVRARISQWVITMPPTMVATFSLISAACVAIAVALF